MQCESGALHTTEAANLVLRSELKRGLRLRSLLGDSLILRQAESLDRGVWGVSGPINGRGSLRVIVFVLSVLSNAGGPGKLG